MSHSYDINLKIGLGSVGRAHCFVWKPGKLTKELKAMDMRYSKQALLDY